MEKFSYDFNSLFEETKGKPVQYKGETIYLADKFPAKYGEKFKITIEETNSKYLQGVGISDGIEIYGKKEKRVAVFEHFSIPLYLRKIKRSKLPFSFEIICRNKKGYLWIYNMALVDGRQDFWFQGCAMKIQEDSFVKRYVCNDPQLNDDFNDIIFTLERIKP